MNKICTYLGFAKKSGNLFMGSETCIINMKKGKVKLLIVAEDCAENSKKKLVKSAESYNVPYRIFGETDVLSHAAGSPGRTSFAITDDNFAKVLIENIDK